VLTLHLRVCQEYHRQYYGLRYESVETVEVVGRAAHNPGYPHRVKVWDSARRTGGRGTHTLSAESVVIAATPVERSPRAGTVQAGDVLALVYPDEGWTEVVQVTSQPLADPTLTPIPGDAR
jgi:hypothetical protein